MKRTVLLACFMIMGLAGMLKAQEQGFIRGTVYDPDGQPMYGVQVIIKGTTNGTISDFDGKFQITVAPGTYTVQATFVSFQTVEISDVTVSAGEANVLDNITMEEAFTELDVVVVAAEVLKVTEAALLNVKKKSTYLIDGISSSNFKKIGDGDAAAASQRVPGVSVEGGKYVYVRGLGDRYTKSILNGMDIPGLDPDRNTLQMDLFPTNVLDNIVVIKSFTPELGADFTGGIVNLETKEFPDEKMSSFSAGLGFNPAMHFNSNYLTYEGSGTDFLGFDNGLRDIPTGGRTDIPFLTDAFLDPAAAAEYTSILGNFNKNLAAMRDNSFMNFSLGYSAGNQTELGNKTLGYNFSVSYKNNIDYYEGAEFGRYGKGNTSDILELDRREIQRGDYGTNNVLIGLMGGVALKSDQAKYKLNIIHLQNGESKAGIFNYNQTNQGSNFEAIQHNLEYNQRALTNILLAGTHFLNQGAWEVEWKVSPTRSSIEDPDIRFTRFRTDGGGFSAGTESGLPQRIWRTLEENNISSKIDVIRNIKKNNKEAKLRFGLAHTYKNRNFDIQNFQFSVNQTQITGDPDEFLNEENLWSRENFGGISWSPSFIPVNTNLYEANSNVMAGYISTEFEATDKIKAVIGVRAEQFVQKYTGTDQNQEFVFDNEKVLDDLDIFPSINFIYNVVEDQNIRLSYSSTIARPSFKEASFANILDPLTGRTFIGGLFRDVDVSTGEVIWDGNLQSTNISNFDLRYETFQPGGQTFSVSAFFKSFKNPIEVVQYVQAANNFQPRNVGDGRIFGAEIELRKNLGFMGDGLKEIDFNANVTIIDSKIDMNPTERQSRIDNARDGETVSDTRDMAGQAPYIINTGLAYQGFDNFINAGLYYNVQGRTLQFVGIADRPDVYTVPFHSLNFNMSKGFGEDGKMTLGLKISNILDSKREMEFESFGSSNQIFNSLAPGRTFSLSFGYRFN